MAEQAPMKDPMKRPLKFPNWHIPYLEKHRIYQLFHEIARELVIQQPDDHVLFMKQILHNAANSCNVTRVIIIRTPKVNSLELAKTVAGRTGHVVISSNDVSSITGVDIEKLSSKFLVKCLLKLVRTENCYSSGWIMVDCIRDQNDAKMLLQAGIIPTHVLHPIAPFHPKLDDILYCNVKTNWPEFRRNIVGIRNTFKNVLREVHLMELPLLKVAENVINLLKMRKPLKRAIPRVVLIGARGSGRKTQAKLLVEELNLVHIDFEYLICQAWAASDELGDKLRECRDAVSLRSDLLSQVVNRRILEPDCMKRGWILTGYPYTVTDFKYLDTLDTPPNIVIFLECDLNVCKDRVQRVTNVYTGSLTHIIEAEKLRNEKGKVFRVHPKDQLPMIEAELNFFCQNYGEIRKYCGDTADLINGDQNERAVNEIITAIIVRGPPPALPRIGFHDLELSSDSDSCYGFSTVGDCIIKKL